MKILLSSHVFAPAIGGIESCSLDLAQAFTQLGHEVEVVTQTPASRPEDDHGLKVIRQPTKADLFRALRWCDVLFQNNISLQTAWPLIFIRKPWVVCTATWLRKPDGSCGVAEHIKKFVLRFATNVYISGAIRDHVGYRGIMVPNPYNWKTFNKIPGVMRARSLVFLGRLVSDKGCDLLIRSLAKLRDDGFGMPLTIIGTGPEEGTLKKLVAAERLDSEVRFAGALRGEALARELNSHRVLVIPSRWDEPFGIVALEGLACGCMVVGSSGGGLPDAIGACGVTFKNGDVADLYRAITQVVLQSDGTEQHDAAVSRHLKNHSVEVVAGRYLKIFKRVCLIGRKRA